MSCRITIETAEPLPLTLWPATGKRADHGGSFAIGFGGNRHCGRRPAHYATRRQRLIWQAAKAAELA